MDISPVLTAVATDQPIVITETPAVTRVKDRTCARERSLLWIALLTPAVLLIHGYHPFSEDAGIYVAGVRKLADPSLYQHDAAFVLANTRFSLFADLLAAILRITGIRLSYVLLFTHLASIFAFLFACRSLARRVFAASAAQWSAVAFAGACFTMPIAGTSLFLMDPYVTARSFATPLGLLTLAAVIDRKWTGAGLLFLLAALMHPLIAAYLLAFVLLFLFIDFGHRRYAWILSLLGVMASAAIYLATMKIPVSAAYGQAILSRTYLFPTQWAWFEYLGLAMPLLIYAAPFRLLGTRTLAGRLCLAAIMLGSSAALSAFLFVDPAGPYLLARLQLLRSFHVIYLVGIVLLGGYIGNRFFVSGDYAQTHRARWAGLALLAATAATMFLAQHLTYPRSAHVELPGAAPRNPWQQAFMWIRANTPAEAVFAANPDLVLQDGEDAQSFRVMTERSLLADYKDEGVAILFPRLAAQWALEYNAQNGLDRLSDNESQARLQPLGVTWLLLSSQAVTSFPCPWRNAVAQVCRLGTVP